MNWPPLTPTRTPPPKPPLTGIERDRREEELHRLFDSFEIRLEQIAETIRRWKAERAVDATGSTLWH